MQAAMVWHAHDPKKAVAMQTLRIGTLLTMTFLAGMVVSWLIFLGIILTASASAIFLFLNKGRAFMKTFKRVPAISLFFLWAFTLPLASGCEEKKPAAGPVPISVRYQAVTVERVTLTRELPGRITAFRVSEVRPQVGGIIKERLFDEGVDVAAGQVLYQIDPSLYQAAYNNAKANLNRAMANEEAARLLTERYKNLVKSNAVSKQERDDAIAAYNQVRAEIEGYRETLESAAINLGYTKITAPVAGRIGRSFVTEGALVTQNQAQPLATIQQLSPVYVDVRQSSVQLLEIRQALSAGHLKSGGEDSAKVRLLLENGAPYRRPGSEEWLEGELLFSDVTVDESTGAVSLRARFDNPEGLLLPGMYVRAELIEGVVDNAVLIPQRCVTRDTRNRPQVFVLIPLKDESAASGRYEVAARNVVIDRDHDGRWLLSGGLAEGDLLLVDGLQKVRPGQVVTGLPADADAITQDKRPEGDISPATSGRR